MEAGKLFAKTKTMDNDGMPWLDCGREYEYHAVRNKTGMARVSASLVRGLISCLSGWIDNAQHITGGFQFEARSKENPSIKITCSKVENSPNQVALFYPHGGADKPFLPYHVGQIAVIWAIQAGCEDFIQSYNALVSTYREHGLEEPIMPELIRASDELYFFLRYGASGRVGDRFENITCNDSLKGSYKHTGTEMDIGFLTESAMTSTEVITAPPALSFGAFMGWQAGAIKEALDAGENILLAGPTGTGKTMSVQQVIKATEVTLVDIEGKDGLLDIDFLGAFLPQTDGSRQWVDGPILRAMRQAKENPVVLFIDEVNRVQRHQTNLLVGLMNKKSHEVCEKMGLETYPGEYYVLEVPMTSETVFCPTAHLRLIAAGNFGRAYAVYDLDPALRRRFDTVIEFDYLSQTEELLLLGKVVTEIKPEVASALVVLAAETRRMMDNGDLPSCVDTSTLINWARKCTRVDAKTVDDVMRCAGLTWADQVCGRNHIGLVNKGALESLGDYLRALKALKDRPLNQRKRKLE